MSLDLYSGSLARYYSRDFETPQQRAAREFRFTYQLVYDGDPPEWLSPEVATTRIEELKTQINEKQEHEFPDLATWDDSVTEYCAEQLFRESLDALLIVAAYANRPDLDRPKRLCGPLDSDRAYADAIPRKYYFGALAILEAQIFVPSPHDKILLVKDPMGWDQVVTTTGNLKWALGRLAEKVWRHDIDPAGWFARGCVATSFTFCEGDPQFPSQSVVIEEHADGTDDTVLHNAEYAFGVFALMLEFAESRRAPIRQDA